jgi:hypothetical protein
MNFFDDILAQHVADEADREVIRKHPAFAQTVEEIAERDSVNQAWLAKNWDREARKTVREKELEAALNEANERVAAAAASGSDMNFDDILAGLTAKGFVDKGALDAKATEVVGQIKTENMNRDMAVLRFYADTANLALKHKEEFGEELDADGFVKSYLAAPNAGAKSVYETFVATKRAEKAQKAATELAAKHQKDIEEAVAKTREETRRQTLMEVGPGGSIPVDQGKGSSGTGYFQKMRQESRIVKDAEGNMTVPDGKLGDGTATAAIMAQIQKDRAEGKLVN